MLKEKITRLKDFILSKNPYFDTGFDDVTLDSTSGYVANDLPVFPADHLGNYFYLRLPDNVTFDNNNEFQIADCITGLGIQSAVVLVACMRGADADHLMTNLVNTLQAYQVDKIRFVSAIYQAGNVVLQELSKISQANQIAALQKLGSDYTIVSVSFNLTTRFDFKPSNCFTNPCASC